jgi:hypothetical protein
MDEAREPDGGLNVVDTGNRSASQLLDEGTVEPRWGAESLDEFVLDEQVVDAHPAILPASGDAPRRAARRREQG